MLDNEANARRDYLINLLLDEGHGRQTLLMLAIEYLVDAKLVSTELQQPLQAMIKEFEAQIPRECLMKNGNPYPYLLPPSSLYRLRDCCFAVLLAERRNQPESNTPDPHVEHLVVNYGLAPRDAELFLLIARRQSDPLFRRFFDQICGQEMYLFTACAAVLGTSSNKIRRRFQPRSRLCTSGLLQHLGESGGCLDHVCRILRIPVDFVPRSPDDEIVMKIAVVGVGAPNCAEIATIAQKLPDIDCHALNAPSPEHLHASIATIRESSLLLLLPNDGSEADVQTVRAIVLAARAAEVLTLALVTTETASSHLLEALAEAADTVLLVSAPTPGEGGVVQVVQSLVLLLRQTSVIGIDFVDVATILRQGKQGYMGVGTASGACRGEEASQRAVEQLSAQGVSITSTAGVLAILQGSQPTLDDYDAVSHTIHSHYHEADILLIGMVTVEGSPDSIQVTTFVFQ